MLIAYLMNIHPYPSCTFIRREIAGLEACGIQVARFAIRRPEQELVDAADQEEVSKTRYILNRGVLGLLLGVLSVAITKPLRFWRTVGLTLKLAQRSDRGLLVNLAYLAEACILLGWLSPLPVEQVHAHFATNATTVALLCHELGGPPYSFTVHGPHEFDKPEFISLPEKIKRSQFVVAVSSYGKSQLYRWCNHQLWSKIHIVHCGVDPQFFERSRQPMPKEPCFVCIGRLGEQKGQLLLVQGAAQLAAQGLRFKIMLVGDGPLRSEIEDLISQFNLQDYLEITGWASSDQVQEYIIKSRALVLPSFAEGLPVVIMESFALNRPVLSTYVAGIPELVTPGECGWLVPAGSLEALTTTLQTVLETPVSQLEQMGQIGYQRVQEQHNVLKEAQKLAKLFESVKK